jgi:peroxiredoxin
LPERARLPRRALGFLGRKRGAVVFGTALGLCASLSRLAVAPPFAMPMRARGRKFARPWGAVPLLLLSCVVQQPAKPKPAGEAVRAVEQGPRLEAQISAIPPVPARYPPEDESWIGLELRDDERGALVERVLAGSPAAKWGFQAGDVLTRVDEARVEAASDVGLNVRTHPPGDTVEIRFLRKGEPALAQVELDAAPHPEDLIRFQLVGRKAPEISGVVAFQGDVASLGDVKGRVLLLEFWASYCGPCRVVGKVLDDWYRQERAKGLVVLGVTTDTPLRGVKVAEATHMMYPLASDTGAQLAKAYGAREIPMLVVVDRRGVVRDVVLGYDSERMRETGELVLGLLAEDP